MVTTILIPQPYERSALRLIGTVFRWLGEHLKSRRRRRRLRALLDKDARLLDDIGVTRDEVWWALDQPYSVNAALELSKVARRRRASMR